MLMLGFWLVPGPSDMPHLRTALTLMAVLGKFERES